MKEKQKRGLSLQDAEAINNYLTPERVQQLNEENIRLDTLAERLTEVLGWKVSRTRAQELAKLKGVNYWGQHRRASVIEQSSDGGNELLKNLVEEVQRLRERTRNLEQTFLDAGVKPKGYACGG